MAETSRPWGGTTVGDAGPYTDDNWTDTWSYLLGALADADTGVLSNILNELNVTGAVSPVAVNTGIALNDGTFYHNDASVNVVVPAPTVNPRIDRIVLRKSWAAQTVRITRIAGIEGGGAPALTQNDGVTWDMPLFQASITVGGVITLTDERERLNTRIPSMTTAERDAMTAVNGMYIYNETTTTIQGRVGGAWLDVATLGSRGIFGDGSDGNVTTAGGGAGDVTLSRDMFYDNLTISVGDTVTTAGFKIFVRDTLTNLGTIERNGNDAVAAAAGAALGQGTTGVSNAGGNGTTNGAGIAGGSDATFGTGGNGGAGGAAGASGGGGGGSTAILAIHGHLRALPQAILAFYPDSIGVARRFRGGAGGGGGGGDATPGTGGGGGSGGGIIVISARILNNGGGTIEANGGAGANGVAANGGGGGGGGGGAVILVTNTFTSGTEQALGGSLGTGIGTGANGVAGVAGVVIQLDGS